MFSNNPKNIKNEMLSPTNKTNFSVDPILFIFSICRINNPNKPFRKRIPKIGLTNGMFKRMATSVRKINPSKIRIPFLIPRLFIIFIFSPLTLHKILNILRNSSI